jgi:ketosteroid isomerase-like protein
MSQGPNGFDAPEPSDPYDDMMDPDDEAARDEISDTLDAIDQGDPAEDEANLCDTSWVPPDRPPGHGDFGTTLREEREGESLDLRLSEEEPDVFDEAQDEDDAEVATEREAEDPVVRGSLVAEGGDTDVPAPSFEEKEPRAGRLVAEDEGAHADEEADLVARDVGISGAGASAEEAAVHIVDDEE